MAQRSIGALTTPPWLLGPGLVVPPIFLPLVLCVWPRPVPPPVPVPELEQERADQYVARVLARSSRQSFTDSDRELVSQWIELQSALTDRRDRGVTETARLARAQFALRHSCTERGQRGRRQRLLTVGDWVAVTLTATLVGASPGHRGRLARQVRQASQGFRRSARRSGLVDAQGRLRAHLSVPLTLARMGWRVDCGLPPDLALEPEALDAWRLFQIQFGWALRPEQRLRALERFAERHPDYRVLPARTALLIAADQRERALVGLHRALSRRPDDLAIRNHLLFVRSVTP